MVTSAEGINFHVSYSSTNINWRLELKGTASLGTKGRVFGALVAAKWDFIHFLVRVNRIKELIWLTNMSVFYKFCTRFFNPNSLLESQDQWMICETSLQLPKLWSHLAQGSPRGFCSAMWWQKEGLGASFHKTILTSNSLIVCTEWQRQAHIVLSCPRYTDCQVLQKTRELCWGQKHLTLPQQILYNFITKALPTPNQSACFHICGAVLTTLIQGTALKTAYIRTYISLDTRKNGTIVLALLLYNPSLTGFISSATLHTLSINFTAVQLEQQ